MSADIIPFPRHVTRVAPPFFTWLHAKLGARKCYVVRQRRPTFHGIPWSAGTVLLLHREYDALVLEYEAIFGVRVR